MLVQRGLAEGLGLRTALKVPLGKGRSLPLIGGLLLPKHFAMGPKGEGKSSKGARAEKAACSRAKQDAIALTPRVPLLDPESHQPLLAQQARVKDSQNLGEILKMMTSLSPTSLSIVIKTAESMIKPPTLAVIDARRATLQPKASPTTGTAKAKGGKKETEKDGPPQLSDEQSKLLGEFEVMQSISARQKELFSSFSQTTKKLARALSEDEAEDQLWDKPEMLAQFRELAQLRSSAYALRAFALEHKSLLAKSKAGHSELMAVWQKEAAPPPFWPKARDSKPGGKESKKAKKKARKSEEVESSDATCGKSKRLRKADRDATMGDEDKGEAPTLETLGPVIETVSEGNEAMLPRMIPRSPRRAPAVPSRKARGRKSLHVETSLGFLNEFFFIAFH